MQKRWIGAVVLAVGVAGYGGYSYFAPANVVERISNEEVKLLSLQTVDTTYVLPPNETVQEVYDIEYGTATGIPSFETVIEGREGTPPKSLIRRGSLVIPDANVYVPVFEGTNDAALYWGAGTAKPNQQLGHGNYSLSAHNYLKVDSASDWFFSGLQNEVKPNTDEFVLDDDESAAYIVAESMTLSVGDPIYIRDADTVYEYHVILQEAVDERDAYVLEDARVEALTGRTDTSLITLTTCFEQHGVPVPSTRLVVTGEYVTSYSVDELKTMKSDVLTHFDKVGGGSL